MIKGRSASLLPFFLLVFFASLTLPAAPLVTLFGGFVRQQPADLLPGITALDSAQIRKELLDSGFFRRVEVREYMFFRLVGVEEYPLIGQVEIQGNTVYTHEQLTEWLDLASGQPFNLTSFRRQEALFYQQTAADGYTHLVIEEIVVEPQGTVRLRINEGILVAVVSPGPEGDGISPGLLKRFFGACLNRPFNSLAVRYALEELLYSEAFFDLRSEVQDQQGRVTLVITADRKRLNRLNFVPAYSGLSGLELALDLSWIGRGGQLRFYDWGLKYLSHQGDAIFRLALDGYSYRRNLKQNDFSLGWLLDYLSIAGRRDVFFFVTPAYRLSIAKDIFLVPFARVGFGLALDQGAAHDRMVAEVGARLAFDHRSDLDEFQAGLQAEALLSLWRRYSFFSAAGSLIRKWSWADVNARFSWHSRAGVEAPAPLFPIPEAMIVPPAGLAAPRATLALIEFTSPTLARLFRLGIFAQYGRSSSTTTTTDVWDAVGLKLSVAIRALPLVVKVFRAERAWQFWFGSQLQI